MSGILLLAVKARRTQHTTAQPHTHKPRSLHTLTTADWTYQHTHIPLLTCHARVQPARAAATVPTDDSFSPLTDAKWIAVTITLLVSQWRARLSVCV